MFGGRLEPPSEPRHEEHTNYIVNVNSKRLPGASHILYDTPLNLLSCVHNGVPSSRAGGCQVKTKKYFTDTSAIVFR